MSRILVVTNERWVRNGVHAALSVAGTELIDHEVPATAAETAFTMGVDAVVVDLQIGAMGGMAVTRAIKDRAGDSRPMPVVMLLDRAADAFLAGRSGADDWVGKPFSSRQLRDAVATAVSAPA
jgi:two-component system, response regulator FlrC